ncbi:MAG: T9SS type A sorting domain-containing protein [Bacteroidales bacterium]|nr:T9SS type A sorting domain-containing protein [Bacteroidales bacterium]
MAWFLMHIYKSTMMEKRSTLIILLFFIFSLSGIGGVNADAGSGPLYMSAEEEKLSLYPNPARDQLKIEFRSDNLTSPEIQIIDLTGKVVKRFDRKMNHEQDIFNVELDISTLQPGVYFVKVIQGDRLFSKKLMVN